MIPGLPVILLPDDGEPGEPERGVITEVRPSGWAFVKTADDEPLAHPDLIVPLALEIGPLDAAMLEMCAGMTEGR